MKKFLRIALFLAGFAIGAWHHILGMSSVFVFKGDESLFTWLAMISGPLSTLPAVIVSLFRPRFGGYWLVGGALVSLLSVGVGGELTLEQVGTWFVKMSTPMLLVGAGLLVSDRMAASDKDSVSER